MPASLHTKKIFANSMKELMRETPFSDISVGDIAAHCGMSRNAFYYHFKDKYDLVTWIFRTESAPYLAIPVCRSNWAEILRGLCRYFRANREFYCNALRYTGQNSLQNYLFEAVSHTVMHHIISIDKPEYKQWSEKETRFAADFFGVTVVGLLVKWALDGMDEDPDSYLTSLSRILSGSILEDYFDSIEA